jgi:hypothetical protein
MPTTFDDCVGNNDNFMNILKKSAILLLVFIFVVSDLFDTTIMHISPNSKRGDHIKTSGYMIKGIFLVTVYMILSILVDYQIL